MKQSEIKKIEKVLQEAAKVFGDMPIEIPLESIQDKLREAASVLAYFDMHEKFKTEVCRNCNQEFAYAYYLSAVKCCSIPCMAAALAEIGLSWNPEAPLERRWGRYVPAIVPPKALEVIKPKAQDLEDPEPMTADDLLDYISNL